MKREFKGTKGKWIVEEGWDDVWKTDTYTINTFEDSVENVEFITVWAGLDKKESKYNAQLISCDPEMLEVLKESLEAVQELQQHQGGWMYLEEKISSLIEKAIG